MTIINQLDTEVAVDVKVYISREKRESKKMKRKGR